MKEVIQHLLSSTPTRIVLVLDLFVPFLFTVIWMTGYHNAIQRIGLLQIAVVNLGGVDGESSPCHLVVIVHSRRYASAGPVEPLIRFGFSGPMIGASHFNEVS